MNKKKLTQNINSTVVVSDIRNFTGLFNYFQYSDDASFVDFMNVYIEIHLKVAQEISNNFYVSSTGDGVLVIFMSEHNHHKNGYAFAIAMHRKLNSLCAKFNDFHNVKVDFGIGIDSGDVWKIKRKHANKTVYTYLGSVINRAARIESQTKNFSKVNALIGQHTFRKLVKYLYPDFYNNIKRFYSEYELTISDSSDFIKICKKLMLFFVSDVNVQGINNPISLFKISPSLLYNDVLFWELIEKLIGNDKKEVIKKIID